MSLKKKQTFRLYNSSPVFRKPLHHAIVIRHEIEACACENSSTRYMQVSSMQGKIDDIKSFWLNGS